MSGCCNNGNDSVCRRDIPYPSVSHESVPSQIDNLTLALFGQVTKSVVDGRVVWAIPCDPYQSATIQGVPRNAGEGLLCYLLRVVASLGSVWGIWSSGTAYPAHATVTDGTTLFQSTQYVTAGTALSNTTYWTRLTNIL